MQKIVDQIFCYYREKMPGRDGFCRIRVFGLDMAYIIITNIDDSPGSVTNDIEKIIHALYNSKFISKETTIVEHYEKGINLHIFDVVELITSSPRWNTIDLNNILDILQCDSSEFSVKTHDISHFGLEISLLSHGVNNSPPICECNSIWKKSRLSVFKEKLSKLVLDMSTERTIQEFIKNSDNIDCFAQYYTRPSDEYIAFSEFSIGDKVADFVILTGRSRLEVHIIEIKGAEFNIVQSSKRELFREQINTAIGQIDCHRSYISMNPYRVNKMFHDTIKKVLSGRSIHNSHVGETRQLLVDPDKDVLFYYHVIGGVAKDDVYESKVRHIKEIHTSHLSIDSWNSFLHKFG